MQPGTSVSYVARRAGVARSLLFNWRRRMLEGGLQAVQADEDVVATSRVRELAGQLGRIASGIGLSAVFGSQFSLGLNWPVRRMVALGI
jgi:transposase-like protein